MPTPFDILDGNAAHQTFQAYGSDNNTLLTSILAKLNASLAVTGTFFQATQPVSNAGTFAVQAAQSGTWNIGAITTLPALATGGNVIGGVTQSGTWNIGTVTTVTTVSTVTNLSQFGGSAINIGAGAVSTGTLRTTQASDSPLVTVTGATSDAAVANAASGTLAGYLRSIKDAATDTTTPSPVSAPTLTKGTQSANGFSVQHLKDAGRSTLCMTAEFTFAQTAETLLTMTLSADGAATTTFSSRVITSGKKFRIQSVSATIESLGSGTAPQRAYLRLRRNTAGATTSSSSQQTVWGFVNSNAVVKSGVSVDYDVPDTLEMTGDGTGTFGFTLETPDWVTSTATGRIKITVIGVEF